MEARRRRRNSWRNSLTSAMVVKEPHPGPEILRRFDVPFATAEQALDRGRLETFDPPWKK